MELSGTQLGLRKSKGTTDCLAVLTTEVKTAFHLKNQVLAAFLEITGAYDYVLMDILGRELKKEGVPIPNTARVFSVGHDVGKAYLLFQWSEGGFYAHGL
jgi:hypothetical protein